MRSDDLEAVQELISAALADDPDEFTLELSAARFSSLGAALDMATSWLEGRSYNLSRVRRAGEDWVATYRRVSVGN